MQSILAVLLLAIFSSRMGAQSAPSTTITVLTWWDDHKIKNTAMQFTGKDGKKQCFFTKGADTNPSLPCAVEDLPANRLVITQVYDTVEAVEAEKPSSRAIVFADEKGNPWVIRTLKEGEDSLRALVEEMAKHK
jgi:hypothetical protein